MMKVLAGVLPLQQPPFLMAIPAPGGIFNGGVLCLWACSSQSNGAKEIAFKNGGRYFMRL